MQFCQLTHGRPSPPLPRSQALESMEEEHRLRNEKETQLTHLQERYGMESYRRAETPWNLTITTRAC